MPRKSSNLYQRNGVWWGRIKVGGREHRRSLRTPDRKEAVLRLKAWRVKLERSEIGDPTTPRFREAVLKWNAEVLSASVKPSVRRRYLTSIAKLDDVFGQLRMDQITTRTIAEYISSRAGTVSNATIRRDLTALSRLMGSCIAWGWITDNPARNFDRSIIRERRDPIQPPSQVDYETVLAACPPAMASILRLLAQTGMREMEAVTLERSQVSATRCQIHLIKTKTSRPRTLDWTTPGGDATGALAEGQPDGWLYPSDTGRPYLNFASNFGQVMRKVAAAQKAARKPFRRFRVHDLRHAFAIRWLRNGGGIYRLSRHLGHTSVKTTELYLRYLTSDELQAVMDSEGGGTNRGTEAETAALHDNE